MECLGGYTFVVMTSVIFLGGLQMRDEHGMLRGVYISCYDFCYIFCSLQTRNEHGMFGGVYIFCHDFCHTFRWFENERRAWNA